ncbi:MAG: multidrug transporter MatE [Coprococcus sp.]|nr:multidrug transporter MatE [Coprococcus sp.]
MNLLTDDIKKIYFKYLTTSFGSTLISTIYGIVDTALVGQYHGPVGPAALAVFAPFWNILYSFGLLAGIGGSVLFSTIRGEADGTDEKSDQYFSAAVILGCILTAAAWAAILFFHEPLLLFFGADETLLDLAKTYLMPVKFTVPFFVFGQLFSAFLRNDNRPGLATVSVLAGGVFNIFGDWFFIFALDMGIFGAGLATGIGAILSFLLMLTHFFSKKNTLRFVKPDFLFQKIKQIFVTGFSTCIVDLAMGVLTILLNRQIMRYLGSDALAVYGIIVNIGTFVQCCAYSIGQAAQPIFSVNFGAGKGVRIRACLKYALYTTAVFGLAWAGVSLAAPNMYVYIFMSPTQAVLNIAPTIIRTYSLSFLLLPFNVFSTYYFQALLKPRLSFFISIARGFLISGILIFLLPRTAGAMSIWFSMPITELLVACFAVSGIVKCTKTLSDK